MNLYLSHIGWAGIGVSRPPPPYALVVGGADNTRCRLSKSKKEVEAVYPPRV